MALVKMEHLWIQKKSPLQQIGLAERIRIPAHGCNKTDAVGGLFWILGLFHNELMILKIQNGALL